MSPQDIERMAREAGHLWFCHNGRSPDAESIRRFAALVRAHAMEEAVQICAALSLHAPSIDGHYAAAICAIAIRARAASGSGPSIDATKSKEGDRT